MSFSLIGAYVCDVLFLFCLSLCLMGEGGLVAGLWILLATGVAPSTRGWVAGEP